MNSIEAKFPKVLVVSAAPINRIDATGITMSNLFAGWPIDRIAQIYDSASAPDPAYCAKVWRFSSNDIASVRLAKKILGRFRASRSRQIAISTDTSTVQVQDFSNDLGLLAAVGDIAPFRASPTLLEWADEFAPDVIYTLLGGSRICGLVIQLAKRLGKPVVPHFMDDWPSTLYESHRLRKLFRGVMARRLTDVFRRAPIGLAIGSGMAEAMNARYDKKFDYFMNCVECNSGIPVIKNSDSNAVRFGYVGGLHLNRWRTLLALAETLEATTFSGISLSLEICAPAKDIELYGKHFSSFGSVSRLFSVPPDQVANVLGSYDVLVHAESFSPEDSRFTKLSVSTKIPQYMAAGRPILAIGPNSLSSIQYIVQSQAGLIVTEEGVNSMLTDALRQLAESETRRYMLGQAGYRTALKRHDAIPERRRFALVLSQAAAQLSD
ncbi:hypothetical protein [Variovorax paradoxus]|uniref:hypothetical protein n=1 Tax=Variovorax paradoxus TaxID=34073 RepID=UPI002789AAEA|nr:hypothetical protein [Variovorax paradoxus]MDP9929209.1 glycosyltransferase involved in cell wall biosynthesis [Variovorax paradoxus]